MAKKTKTKSRLNSEMINCESCHDGHNFIKCKKIIVDKLKKEYMFKCKVCGESWKFHDWSNVIENLK